MRRHVHMSDVRTSFRMYIINLFECCSVLLQGTFIVYELYWLWRVIYDQYSRTSQINLLINILVWMLVFHT